MISETSNAPIPLLDLGTGISGHNNSTINVTPVTLCGASDISLGNPIKAKTKLGRVPEITVQEMFAEVVSSVMAEAERHEILKAHGYYVGVSVES